MSIWLIGINHKTAPVALREQVTFDPVAMPKVLSQLQDLPYVNEVALLSTCNRTEIYLSSPQEQAVEPLSQKLSTWLAQQRGIEYESLQESLYWLTEKEAVMHTMRVASGLDSLVLGEPQILGQMKSAFATSQEEGTAGAELGRLFRQTFSIAKRVRTDTAIGENPVSVAFAAVRMAQHIFSDLSDSHALLIGAGETIELVARHLYQAGVKHLTVANRTLARARHLAQLFNADAILLEHIPSSLPKADIVISSTASPLPILGKGAVEQALKKRRHQPMFMVDIAVPRDIEPEVAALDDVYLYSVDDLRDIIEENVRSREDAAQQAEELIRAGAERFIRDLKALDAVTTLTELRQHVELVCDEQLQKSLKQLQNGADAETVLRSFVHAFSNKLLHAPTKSLRHAGAEGRLEVLDWTRELFRLQEKDESSSNNK